MIGINDTGAHMPFNRLQEPAWGRFMQHLKTYKLARLLWQRMTALFRHRKKESSGARQLKRKEPSAEENETGFSQHRYIILGRIRREQGEFTESKQILERAIKINPLSALAYHELAKTQLYMDKPYEAEACLKKATEIEPENSWLYIELAWLYRGLKKDALEEQMFQKALRLDPQNRVALFELGCHEMYHGNYSEAENLLTGLLKLNPSHDKAYRSLRNLYELMGTPEKISSYTDRYGDDFYPDITKQNYRKIKEILDERGIVLICVQYPMRSVEPLKDIFDNQQAMLFVDNEESFKAGVEKEGYDKYFEDRFAGDFGHCTPKGNRLLAGNIADVIATSLPMGE